MRALSIALVIFVLAPFCEAKPPIEKQTNFTAYTGITEGDEPNELVAFARKLMGIKYRYGATHPSKGFDCSGFVYYVFKHFNINIARSSSAIGQQGKTVALKEAQPGDVILFTGTNPAKRSIGHAGIIVSNSSEETRFIHASSGKAMAVTETTLAGSYKKRFMKVVRLSEKL